MRTILQHAWAVLDRRLRYDNDQSIPRQVKRKLYRVSAMLEGADENLTEIDLQVDELKKGYSDNLRKGDVQIPINKDSLEVFLAESPIVKDIIRAAKESGFAVAAYSGSIGDEDVRYNRLVPLMNMAKIKTIGELELILQNLISSPKIIFQKVISGRKTKVPFSVYALIRVLFYFSKDANIHRIALKSGGFAGTTRMQIDKAYSELS